MLKMLAAHKVDVLEIVRSAEKWKTYVSQSFSPHRGEKFCTGDSPHSAVVCRDASSAP